MDEKIEIAQRSDKVLAHETIRNTGLSSWYTDIEDSEWNHRDVVSVASVPNTRMADITLPLGPNWPGLL
jgi:hypothetical protein